MTEIHAVSLASSSSAFSPNPGSLCQVPEAGFQAVTIMTGLFDTELVNAEFGDVR